MGVTTGTGQQAIWQEEAGVSGTHRTEVRSKAGEKGLGWPPCFQDHPHRCSVLCLQTETSPPQGWKVVDSDDGTLCSQTVSSSVRCGLGLAGPRLPPSLYLSITVPRGGCGFCTKEQGIHEQGGTQSPSAGQDVTGCLPEGSAGRGWGESLSVSDGAPPAICQQIS